MPAALIGSAMSNIPTHLAGAVLSIDLAALQANYKVLAARAGTAACGAAIKGNAYGLGVGSASKALWAAGCRDYFVARPTEGEELRGLLPGAVIYVLDGLLAGQAQYYAKWGLRPALISIDEAKEWAAFGRGNSCALHVDTGINRLGLSMEAFHALTLDRALMKSLNVSLLMSHLACSDEPAHPLNVKQRDRFKTVRAMLPNVPASLANSSGIYLGKAYAHDLVRPGVALYGGNPQSGKRNPMKPVATLEAHVLQVRDVKKGETVGYSATWKAPRDSRIAMLGAGYRDGVPRKLSSGATGGPAQVAINGKRCPIVGRVSMDMMCVDVTGLKAGSVVKGTRAEIFGKRIPVDEAAGWAGTISYELLTHLGSRYARVYT
jgi:alanine racemase